MVQPLRGYRSPPSRRMAGGPRDYGFGDPRVMALAGALASTLSAVTGITNKSLRALMTGLLGTAYSVNQASYDLARLSRSGLITPPSRTATCTPSPAMGLRFANLLHQGPRPRPCARSWPATSPRPPPPLRDALRARSTVKSPSALAAARLPAAA